MTIDKFNEGLEERINKIRNSLASKGKEYSTDTDKLHNFKRTAQMNNEEPTRSLHGMLSKHLTSYLDMLDKIDKGEKISAGTIDEKLGDIINYFILQEQLIIETSIL